jgi:hypothetical protein
VPMTLMVGRRDILDDVEIARHPTQRPHLRATYRWSKRIHDLRKTRTVDSSSRRLSEAWLRSHNAQDDESLDDIFGAAGSYLDIRRELGEPDIDW